MLRRLPDVTLDPRRSYEAITLDDLARLGRLGALKVDEFFARNRQLTACAEPVPPSPR